MTELKPCPFCGGAPVIQWKRGYHSARVNREASCRILCGSVDCHVNLFAFGATEDIAIAAWNKRVSP